MSSTPTRCWSTCRASTPRAQFVAEARRMLRSKGVLFVVVPDYLKEREFFWDIDYTHNFITTERRVRQLLYDGGFDITRVVRSIGAATGPARDALAAGALLANLPGLDALSRYTRTEDLLFRVRKNLFETLAFVAHKTRLNPLYLLNDPAYNHRIEWLRFTPPSTSQKPLSALPGT